MTPSSAPETSAGQRHRELIVVDRAIVSGGLASSADPDAPLAFRAQMQWLAGASGEALELTRAWLESWATTTEVGPERAPVAPRPGARRLLAAWASASAGEAGILRSGEYDFDEGARAEAPASETEGTGYPPPPPTASEPVEAPPEGEPGEGSEPLYEPGLEPGYGPAPEAVEPPSGGASNEGGGSSWPLSWAAAPFELIAIVNRVDLAADACEGFAGELRYVFTAVDPATRAPLDFTVILELPYPATRSAAEWARAWQRLASEPTGPGYAEGLAALAREIQAEADPLRARLRTNEVALAEPAAPVWEMREFQPQLRSGGLGLVPMPLQFTPRADAEPALLAEFVLDNAPALERSGAALPEPLRAGAASIEGAGFSWSVLGVSERLRRALSVQTCNGCHGGDTPALPFQHIGPSSSPGEPARLSRFLYDPGAPRDELRRRADVLEALSAAECERALEPGAGYGG